MNDITFLGQIVPGIIVGIIVGIVGFLFADWLNRGQPDVFLIVIEPAILTKLGKTVRLPQDVIELSEICEWISPIEHEEPEFRQLNDIYRTARQETRRLQRLLRKTETLLANLENNTIDENRIKVMRQILNDGSLIFILLRSIDVHALTLPAIKKENALLTVKYDPKEVHGSISVEYPLLESSPQVFRCELSLDYDRKSVPCIEEERRGPLADMIQYCDFAALRESLVFTRDYLQKQYEYANKFVTGIKDFVEKTYWLVEVMVANRGGRTVVLSPYATLLTHGTYKLPDLPLIALAPRKKDTEPKGGEQPDDKLPAIIPGRKSAEQDKDSETAYPRYIVIGPQENEQVTFLADVRDSAEINSKLNDAYKSETLDCSVLLKRENIHGRQRHPTALHSPLALFGGNIEGKHREELNNFAHHTTLWQKLTSK